LIGSATVAFVPDAALITASVLESLNLHTPRLLLHTRNSLHWRRPIDPLTTFYADPFDEAYVAISPDGAQWIVDHGIRLVGIDYASVGAYPAAAPLIIFCWERVSLRWRA
jgi:arylformamidase